MINGKNKNCDAVYCVLQQCKSEMTQLQKGLESLIAETNEALIKARKDCVNDAVNWARARCYDAEVCIGSDGDIIFRVWISDAAPDAHMLQRFVYEYLKRLGIRVGVHTEW